MEPRSGGTFFSDRLIQPQSAKNIHFRSVDPAAKRRNILSLGREPQEHGMEKNPQAAKRRQTQTTERGRLRLTPQPQSVAPSELTELGRLSFLGLTPQAMNLPRLRRSIALGV